MEDVLTCVYHPRSIFDNCLLIFGVRVAVQFLERMRSKRRLSKTLSLPFATSGQADAAILKLTDHAFDRLGIGQLMDFFLQFSPFPGLLLETCPWYPRWNILQPWHNVDEESSWNGCVECGLDRDFGHLNKRIIGVLYLDSVGKRYSDAACHALEDRPSINTRHVQA